MAETDWAAWHQHHAEPGSALSRRLRIIEGHVAAPST